MLAPTANQHITSLPVVHAQSGCNDATIARNYAFVYTGFGIFGNGSRSPINTPGAVVGVLTFDGSGNLTDSFTSAWDGSIGITTSDVGTYTVNSDCTGSLTDTTVGAQFSFAIAGGGAEILAIETNPGHTASLDAKRQ